MHSRQASDVLADAGLHHTQRYGTRCGLRCPVTIGRHEVHLSTSASQAQMPACCKAGKHAALQCWTQVCKLLSEACLDIWQSSSAVVLPATMHSKCMTVVQPDRQVMQAQRFKSPLHATDVHLQCLQPPDVDALTHVLCVQLSLHTVARLFEPRQEDLVRCKYRSRDGALG